MTRNRPLAARSAATSLAVGIHLLVGLVAATLWGTAAPEAVAPITLVSAPAVPANPAVAAASPGSPAFASEEPVSERLAARLAALARDGALAHPVGPARGSGVPGGLRTPPWPAPDARAAAPDHAGVVAEAPTRSPAPSGAVGEAEAAAFEEAAGLAPFRAPVAFARSVPSGPSAEERARASRLARLHSDYYDYLRGRIDPLWEFPRARALLGEEGTVRVAFIVRRDGSVAELRVTKRSGISDFDTNVVAAIRRAGPFRPPPAELSDDALRFEVPFDFDNPVVLYR